MTLNSSNQVTVLMGGGIDSTALVRYYQKLNYQPEGIFFDYSQPSSREELKAVTNICNFFEIGFKTIKLSPALSRGTSDEFKCRNALFILNAAAQTNRAGIIGLGIHSGTKYFDCSSGFLSSMQVVLDGYFGGSTKLDAPFVSWSKFQILDYFKDQCLPIDITYSCQYGKPGGCGVCSSCEDRKALGVN